MIAKWEQLRNRIQLEVTQRLGRHNGNTRELHLTAIKVVMLVDCNGEPLSWIVESTNVEPGNKAKAFLELL
jgi:hypothetical protein